MKNVLVTGGAGYIGSHTAVELVKAGYRPVIIDNFSNSQKSVLKNLEKIVGQKIKSYEHDYQDPAFLKKVLSDESIDGVIHFAAYKAVGESVEQPLKYYDNNVAGFINFLEVLNNQASVPPVVFSSSCTVYGEPDKLPVTEDSAIKPAVSPYGATKQICESILKDATAANPHFRGLSLRYFNPIGAHSSALIGELPIGVPANLIPFLTQVVAGQRPALTVFGDDYPTLDGTCVRDYIHVVDLAEAHIAALEYLDKQKVGFYDTFNIGTGKGSSVLEVIKTFEKATGQKVPYKIGPRRAGDVVSTYAGVNKAKKLLGWQTKKTLAEALKDAWRWQQTLSNFKEK